MFPQQSRAQFAPMSAPPGSPRQGGGFGGKGGASTPSPASGGKGGGRQMAPRNFDSNPGQQAGLFGFANQMMGGPAMGANAASPSPNMFGGQNLQPAFGSGMSPQTLTPIGSGLYNQVRPDSSGVSSTPGYAPPQYNPRAVGQPLPFSPMYSGMQQPSFTPMGSLNDNFAVGQTPALSPGILSRLYGGI